MLDTMDIPLDKDVMKALANEKRVEMLKLFGSRRHMQSEIASIIGLAVPTVKEHLIALEKAGLIERFDEGRKWKYYGITKKGKGILQPEQTRIWIVLSVFILSIIGLMRTWLAIASQIVQGPIAPMAQPMMKAATLAASVPEAAPLAPPTFAQQLLAAMDPQVNPWFDSFIVLAAVIGFLLIHLILLQKNEQKQLGKSLTKKERINK